MSNIKARKQKGIRNEEGGDRSAASDTDVVRDYSSGIQVWDDHGDIAPLLPLSSESSSTLRASALSMEMEDGTVSTTTTSRHNQHPLSFLYVIWYRIRNANTSIKRSTCLFVLILIYLSYHHRKQKDTAVTTARFKTNECPIDGFNISTIETIQSIFHNDPTKTECFVQDKKSSKCKCINPTVPRPLTNIRPGVGKKWQDTFQWTKKMVANAASQQIDMVMLGDSITESWLGTGLGQPKPNRAENHKVFQKLFTKAGGGQIETVALGIGSERCPNLLYRLRNDLLSDLQTKIFWLLIGTNDIGGEYCSEDAVVAGIIAIVEELRSLRPDTTIVVNSLLPRLPIFWKHMVPINEQIECYVSHQQQRQHENSQTAKQPPKIRYFDATSIFMNETTNELKSEYLPDNLHPNGAGALVWGNAILKVILEILDK